MVQAASEYDSVDRVETAIQTHAQSVLDQLADQQYLRQGTVSELDIQTVLPGEQYMEAAEGTTVWGVEREDTTVSQIQVKRDFEFYELLLIVVPQLERARAIVTPKVGSPDKSTVIEPDDGPSTQTHDCDDCVGPYGVCDYRCSSTCQCYCVRMYIYDCADCCKIKSEDGYCDTSSCSTYDCH